VAAPGERFNFAQHLLAANAGRAAKAAFVDDAGAVSYGQLDERVRRMAAGLRGLGLKREERVLLLMQDTTDWPVAFLGAMYAGLVPVAVNTLLTADDYAYMLEHSRAQAVLVSGALLPVLTSALVKSDHEVQKVVVSRPVAPLHPAEVELESFLAANGPLSKPAATSGDDPGFWLYSSGSTGRPKGTVHSHANPYYTCELYGKAVLGLTEADVCFSAAKLFFAYGLGNGLTFPMSVGATTLLMPERPTPDATFKRWLGGVGGLKPTVFYGAPTGFAGMLAHPALPARDQVALRLVSSAGEALPAELGERFKRHFGLDIIDGIGSTEMLHIFISNAPGRVRYGSTGWPPLHPRPQRRDDVLGQPCQDARNLSGRLDQKRRQIRAQRRRRQLHLQRPQRRHAQGQRHLCVALRGGSHPGDAPRRAGSRRHRRGRRRGPDQDQGLCGAQGRRGGERRRAQGLRQGEAGALQIPAPDRLCRRPAKNRDRQDPALQAAGPRTRRMSPPDRPKGSYTAMRSMKVAR
jgi:benzoate-CoA ligase